MDTDLTASARYDVSVRPPARWAVPLLALAAVIAAAVTQVVERTYGGRRVTVTDRGSGEVVGEFREGLLVHEQSPVGLMLADVEQMTAEEFREAWLASPHNRRQQPSA